MKNILISGGTGFLGTEITLQLERQGYHIYILTRSTENKMNTSSKTYIGYNVPATSLPHMNVVINLAGESLFGYWTERKKASILDSRLMVTNHLIQLLEEMDTKPAVFINASAVGYYGMSEDLIFTEKTTNSGEDFLATVTKKWEATASAAEDMGIRTVYTRLGILLGKEGALPMMKLPVQLFAGGHISDGEQWISWVHIEDAARLILFCIRDTSIKGPINITAPYPKRNKDFMKTIANVHRRPYWLHVPSLFMDIILGDMAQLVTKGQYAYPQKALDYGFSFRFPKLHDALENVKKKQKN